MIFLLVACSEPISNDLFYEDEAYLQALPSTKQIGFSTLYANQPRQSEDLGLTLASTQAIWLDRRVSLATIPGDILRTSAPSERSSTHRSWESRPVLAPDGASISTYYIQAEILRRSAEGDLFWTIDVSVNEDGPWQIAGSGQHDPDGRGEFTWDLPMLTDLLGMAPERLAMDVAYDLHTHADDPREVQFSFDGIGSALHFEFIGDQVFVFFGMPLLQHTLGAAAIYQGADGFGRSLIQLVEGEVVVNTIETCWDLRGATLYQSGDSIVPDVADPSACPVADPFRDL